MSKLHDLAEKFIGTVSGVSSVLTRTHLNPCGAAGVAVVGGLNRRPSIASLIPSLMARLSISYDTQIDAMIKIKKSVSSNRAARCAMASKFGIVVCPL